MVMLDHMDDCLTPMWRCCSDMRISLGKIVLMMQKENLKAWLLLCWCYNHWMTLEDTTTLSYLSALTCSREAFEFHKLKLELSLSVKRTNWLKCKRLNWIRGFHETQSRIYASSCTENYVCLIADNFWLESALFSTTAILFGISGDVPVLIFLFLMI